MQADRDPNASPVIVSERVNPATGERETIRMLGYERDATAGFAPLHLLQEDGADDSVTRPSGTAPTGDGGVRTGMTGKATGTWNATDPDNIATLTLFVNNLARGTLETAARTGATGGRQLNDNNGGASQIVIAGKYGDLTLKFDGTWEYVLVPDRADAIARNELVYDLFAIRLEDDQLAPSTIFNLRMMILGTNDAPTGLSNSATTQDTAVWAADDRAGQYASLPAWR